MKYLTYIESTGTQYIDTKFKPNQDTRIVMDFLLKSEDTADYRGIFGVRDTVDDNAPLQYLLWIYPDGTFRTDYFGTNRTFTVANITKKIVVDKNKNVTSLDNQIITNTARAGQCTENLYLLCANNGGIADYFTDAKLYSCQIYDNGTLVRDFAPAENDDGTIGLYDRVNDTFYVNAGTGEFIAGDPVKKETSYTFQNLIEDAVYYARVFPRSIKGAYQTTPVGQVAVNTSRVYGISRDITASSPEWTRTDLAVGMTATASVGTSAGASDFDNRMPWKGIVRETLSTGDVMVKIPKFWFQRYREGNNEYIKIADNATSGFTLHPLFNHGGVESDYAYVGAYKTSSNNKSVSGASPQVSQTRATMRSNAKSKGTGWSLIDISALSAIQMLILVEFANNNVQSAIGRGYCDGNSAALKTGSCDSVSNLTGRPAGTDGKVDVVWRGIEGFWGNVWEWVDGLNFNGGIYYVCNDISKYADNTATGYEQLSYAGATNWSSSYITEEGLDTGNNSHVLMPKTAGSGSASTYECDACWSSTGWRVFSHGGDWGNGSACGLFTAALDSSSSYSYTNVGSRLLYIPS